MIFFLLSPFIRVHLEPVALLRPTPADRRQQRALQGHDPGLRPAGLQGGR